MAISKKALITLALIGLFIGMVSIAVALQHFYPQIKYTFEGAPITVAYTEIDKVLEFDPLFLGVEQICDCRFPAAIIVHREGTITVGFKEGTNLDDFSAFKVQIWSSIESEEEPTGDPKGEFWIGSGPAVFPVAEDEEYGYYFIFTTNEIPSATGIITLDVSFDYPDT